MDGGREEVRVFVVARAAVSRVATFSTSFFPRQGLSPDLCVCVCARLPPGKKEKITITSEKGRLSPEDIERMVKEAEEFAEQVGGREGLFFYYSFKSFFNNLINNQKQVVGP